MPAGLETYDAAGNLLTSYTDSLPRKVGFLASTGSANGSLYSAVLASVPDSRVWWYVNTFNGAFGADGGIPDVSVSNGTLSWTYNYTNKYDASILYGVF